MDKKLRLPLLLCLLHLTFTGVFATNEPAPARDQMHADVCNAPAPDSFHVTNRGSNSIDLSWIPAWDGATHTLIILTKSNTTDWTPLDTLFNITGSSCTINDVDFEAECKIFIASNCSSGEPSSIQVFVLDKVILELVIGASAPVNPVEVECNQMDFSSPENTWLGFRVSRDNEGDDLSNLFEFEITHGKHPEILSDWKVKIKRYSIEHPIVAANQGEVWPTIFTPSVQSWPKINIYEILNNEGLFHKIGAIDVYWNIIAGSVDMCIANDPPWDDNYFFETLMDKKKEGDFFSNNSGRSKYHFNKKDVIVQNPFNETLSFFIPETNNVDGVSSFSLMSSNGETVYRNQFDASSRNVTFPVDHISNGFYVLRIETEGEVHNLKIIKTQ